MKNDLILLSGADIPFSAGSLTIHQPSIYEISMIGEKAFFTGCELLKFSKNILTSQDKINLSNQSDFNILMSIMNDKSGSMTFNITCAKAVLNLLFPDYKISFTEEKILIQHRELVEKQGEINQYNFKLFKDILISMFCLKQAAKEQTYNAHGELAKKIAAKLQNRQKQLAELSNKTDKIAIFSRYISILAVGEHKDMNSFMKYTVYQLFDEFQRYQLKISYDTYIEAKMAGAKDLKEPEDWTKDIHS